MNLFLELVFLIFVGSMLGWVLELFFRRIVHGKWVNPGLLIGPYLPIYGVGLMTMTVMYYLMYDLPIHPILIILLMGLFMTISEFIGGLIGLKNNVKLWDYRWYGRNFFNCLFNIHKVFHICYKILTYIR